MRVQVCIDHLSRAFCGIAEVINNNTWDWGELFLYIDRDSCSSKSFKVSSLPADCVWFLRAPRWTVLLG